MAVRDGVVAWLGSDDVARTQFPDADVVDLDGAFVAPAFVDSHVHVTATGLAHTGLDLRPAESKQHFLTLLAEHVAASPDGVVWGHGWDQSGWPDREVPTTAELDAVLGAPARLPGARRRALRARVDRPARAGARPGRRGRLRRAGPAVRRRPSPGAGGRPGTAVGRAARRGPHRRPRRVRGRGCGGRARVRRPRHRRPRRLAGTASHAARRRGDRLLGRGRHHRGGGAFAHRDHRRERAGRRPVRRRGAGLAHRVAQPCVRRRTRLLRQPVPRRRCDRRPPRRMYAGAGARGLPRHR